MSTRYRFIDVPINIRRKINYQGDTHREVLLLSTQRSMKKEQKYRPMVRVGAFHYILKFAPPSLYRLQQPTQRNEPYCVLCTHGNGGL